jgi:hypothetical protein
MPAFGVYAGGFNIGDAFSKMPSPLPLSWRKCSAI